MISVADPYLQGKRVLLSGGGGGGERRNLTNALLFLYCSRLALTSLRFGKMGSRLGITFLLILSISWVCADARIMEASDVTAMQINYGIPKSEIDVTEVNSQNEKLCTVCEEFTSQAVDYLNQNKTQIEIMDAFHRACSRLHSFEQQCILLADYYAPLLFLEVGLISPESFCKKVGLCEMVHIPVRRRDDTCTICHHAVSEILIKLKDPETQLEIIEALIKSCNKVEQFKQQCKKLVFEFGPVILVNAEKFLETTDICTSIHACKANEAKPIEETYQTELLLQDA